MREKETRSMRVRETGRQTNRTDERNRHAQIQTDRQKERKKLFLECCFTVFFV